MVTYIRSDLEFILKQIKIAEAHAAGMPLYGAPNALIPTYNLAWGLRTVDGSYNHLLNPTLGAADHPFPELLDPSYRPAEGTPLDMDGPAPEPALFRPRQTITRRTVPTTLSSTPAFARSQT